MGVDLHRTVDQLADAPGQGARRQLALAAQDQDPAAQLGDNEGLHEDDCRRHQAQPHRLHDDEGHGRDRLPAQEGRRHEGIADETAPSGSTSSLIMVAISDCLTRRIWSKGNRRMRSAQLVAKTAQHALAHAALARVDRALEQTVDQNQAQEHEAEPQQHVRLLELETLKDRDGLAEEHLAEG